MRKKVSIIGAGNVGATCAQRIFEKGYADVVMVDIVEGLPQGKALDISQSAPVLGVDASITGSNNYKATAGSDVVIITSGSGRKPGMTRDELLQINLNIVTEVTRQVAANSPDCVIIMVTNPVDVMTRLAIEVTRFPRNRAFGLSGVLDGGGRLASFIAAELKVSVKNMHTCVMGEHGQNMVVIPRLCTVNGTPITKLLPEEKIDALAKRTVGGGAEIVELLKTGSAFYAPSAAAVHMAEAVLMDKKQVLNCATYLRGEYGLDDTVIGVPVKLGADGIEEIIELELTPQEKERLAASAAAVRENSRAIK